MNIFFIHGLKKYNQRDLYYKILIKNNNKIFLIKNNKNVFLSNLMNLIFIKNKNKIDILFSSHHENFLGVMNVIFSKIYKKKSLVRMAGNLIDAYKFKKNILNRYFTYLIDHIIAIPILKKADKIIVMSQYIKNELIKIGYDENKIEIIMQPIEYKSYQLKKSEINKIYNLKLSKSKKNILFAGNLTKGKGIDSFINLLKSEEINSNFNFIFAGKDRDNYFSKLEKFDNVTLLGKVTKEELIKYYYSVDLFLFPSYFEGFPKVVTEVYCSGCPIITRDIVNLDRLADDVFNDDDELKNLLLNFNYKRKNKIIWPKEFEEKYIKEKYLNIIEEI